MIRFTKSLVQHVIHKYTGYSWMIVASREMEPTLKSGDLLITRSKEIYDRKDIVVYRDPESKIRGKVNRIVGVPGDMINASHGKIYLNQVELVEEYVKNPYPFNHLLPHILFNNGIYCIIGDNRILSNSWDEMQGIRRSEIVGVVVRIVELRRYLGWLCRHFED